MDWSHWEILLLVPMMMVDHFLTHGSFAVAERGYRRHFRIPHMELNPVWQKSVEQKRWFNPRHHFLAVVLPVACFFLERAIDDLSAGLLLPLREVFVGVNGAMLAFYSIILGGHIGNLFTFRRIVRLPGEISGTVEMQQSYVLAVSRNHHLGVLLPLAFVAAFERHPFAIGAATSPVLLFLVNLLWASRTPKSPSITGKPATSNLIGTAEGQSRG